MPDMKLEFHRIDGGLHELGWQGDSLSASIDALVRDYLSELEVAPATAFTISGSSDLA